MKFALEKCCMLVKQHGKMYETIIQNGTTKSPKFEQNRTKIGPKSDQNSPKSVQAHCAITFGGPQRPVGGLLPPREREIARKCPEKVPKMVPKIVQKRSKKY